MQKILNSAIEITKTQADTLIAANELTVGQLYKITGTTGQSGLYVDLYLTALTANKFALGGNGLFYNPDYQAVGDYSGVCAETGIGQFVPIANVEDVIGNIAIDDGSFDVAGLYIVNTGLGAVRVQQGIWTVAKEATLVNNNVVIWNGVHYAVTDATLFNGTNPSTNSSAYGNTFSIGDTIVVSQEVSLGYIPELDIIKYDYPNDWLAGREDKRGNAVELSFLTSQSNDSSTISVFKWGDNKVFSNKVLNGVFNCINCLNFYILGNIVEQNSQFYTNSFGTVLTKVTNEQSVYLSESVQNRIYDGRPLVYTALLNQPDTNAPVATVLENTLGGLPVITYGSSGYFYITLAGAFTIGKTVVRFGNENLAAYYPIRPYFNSEEQTVNQLIFGVYNTVTGLPVDTYFYNTSIEIKVYP